MNHKGKRCLAGVLLFSVLGMSLSFAASAEEILYGAADGSIPYQRSAGPGSSVSGIIDDSQGAGSGPTVETVSLSEAYYDEFECYSESLGGAAVIYSNTGNNSITDKSVYVDIPANVSFRFEKDGVEMPYAPKAFLTERGSYRFQLTAVRDPDLPVSEQTLYKAVFNFRIAERTKPAKEQTAAGTGGITSYYTFPSEIFGENRLPETAAAAPEPETAEIPPETVPETEMSVLTFEEETEPAPSEQEVVIEETAPELSFDPLTGQYTKEFEDGSRFRASVASGMPVNSAVTVDADGVKGGADRVKVYRDDEEMEMPEDGVFTEPGEYELRIPTENGAYHYRFLIFTHPVQGPVSLHFPEGTLMDSITLSGEETGYLTDSDGRIHAELSLEGTYELIFTDACRQRYETVVVIDNTPPVVKASHTGKAVTLSYEDPSDIARVVVGTDGGEYEESVLYELREPGSYTLSFYDEAGNETRMDVTVRKSVNIASVIAVLLIIGILSAGVVFFWKVRNKAVIK